jgi:hypothetical protein
VIGGAVEAVSGMTSVARAAGPGGTDSSSVSGPHLGAELVVLDGDATIAVAQRESERSRLAHQVRTGSSFCRIR